VFTRVLIKTRQSLLLITTEFSTNRKIPVNNPKRIVENRVFLTLISYTKRFLSNDELFIDPPLSPLQVRGLVGII
jgi:hypothetical protein